MKILRPIVCFDLETTGTDRATDRIVQFCFIRMNTDSTTDKLSRWINPQMEIPAAATAVHGITNDMVSNFQPFEAHAEEVLDFIEGCDLAGFNCLVFDVPVLFNELYRSGIVWDYTKHSIIDACNIYKRNAPRDLTSALLHYCKEVLNDAHNATTDTEATLKVFMQQVATHELPETVEAIALYSNYDKPVVDLSGKFSVNDEGEIVFSFSKHKGEVASKHPGFLNWMLDQPTFTPDVKIICRRLLYPENYTTVIASGDTINGQSVILTEKG